MKGEGKMEEEGGGRAGSERMERKREDGGRKGSRLEEKSTRNT